MTRFDARDWPIISALFDQALDSPAPQRREWLESLPEDQIAHRQTLEWLLANHAHVETQDFLSALPRVGVSHEPDESADGTRTVGPYRLLRELGRGGMGSVWLAERTDGLLKRQVALKLPHPGLATQAFAERLTRERDILASLDHPHIARMYDAGLSSEGQPYIALAYVQGRTLIEDTDARQLTVPERVALFRQVLEAVQYAHAHLVIHRDLKPSNVLVDEQGQVHLLDFGIAKLLIDGQAEATELTLDAGRALTPDYASPEQIAGGAISTASDVYSLGVLLYRLLAGARPYRLQRGDAAAMVQELRQMTVPPPSSVARDAPTAKVLRGDLDTIVLKALSANTVARYASAEAFNEDLRRHLHGEPVLARPDAWTYRAGKFLRRHRVSMAVAMLTFASLGAGLAGTAWQARQASRQAQRAEAVKDFLIGLFHEADPARKESRELSAKQLLDRGQLALQTRLADQPRLRVELDGVLAQLYTDVNAVEKALPLAEARRDLSLQLDGPDSLAYADALYALADIQGGLRHQAQSYQTFLQARPLMQRYASERQDELLKLEGHLSYQLNEMGRFKEAATVLDAVLPKMAARFGPRSWEVILYKVHLARSRRALGDESGAAALEREVEPLLDDVSAEHAFDAFAARHNLALSVAFRWQMDAAARLLRKSLADAEHLFGPDTRPVVDTERNLATVLHEGGHYEEAVQTFERNVQRAVRTVGEDSPITRLGESLEVRSLIMLGRTAEAAKLARRSMAVQIRADVVGIGSRSDFENRLGLALIFDGKADEAVRLLERTAADAQQTGATSGDVYGRTLHFLAGALAARGEWAQALATGEQAQKVFEHSPSGRDMLVARSQLGQAIAAAHAAQPAQAQALIDAADVRLRRIVDPDHPAHLLLQLMRAEVLRAGAQRADAEHIDEPARGQLKAHYGVVLPRFMPLIF
jgi:tRNA A-37 threonylcarbamoyl transferase component Bud32/tetratricopeptide (TPR) repeat protein